MTTPKKPWTARRIHLWIAVILAIPMVLMAATGILISMRSVANLPVPMKWMASETVPERLPIMAYLEGVDGTVWVGNANGLYAITPGGAKPVEKFTGQEVVGLATLPGKDLPLVATRMAIWNETDGAWEAVKRGRVRQLSSLPDGRVLAISGGRGEMADGKPMVTRDGASWTPYKAAMQANAQLPKLENPSVALHTFMRELHSGAYFLGKGPGEMVWSNVMGWVLVLLSLTGLWMWLKRERQRVREIKAALHGRNTSPQGAAA
jgi:hypothetical protein